MRRPTIVFANGMLNVSQIKRGDEPELQEFHPKFFCETALPYEFDPSAECPLWEETINEILARTSEDDHRLEVFQEFLGLTLVPGDVSFQRFLTVVGSGANGKSTVMKVWEALLGEENVSHVPLDALSDEFRLIQMRGRLANIASDMQYMDKVAEGRLKELVSGDPMDVNRKHKPPISMVPTARLIFGANELPRINDKTDGVWRRMIAMPFLEQFKGKRNDRTRVSRLMGELPGIFNWALAGARRLYRQGDFTPCAVCEAALNDHRYESDPIRQFVDQRLDIEELAVVKLEDLYRAYSDWCKGNGCKPLSSASFAKYIESLPGVTKRRPGTQGPRPRVFVNVSLRRD